MAEAARWYLALVMIGAGGVLPSMLLFGGLRSGGVLYARPLALLLIAEGAWLIAAETPIPYGLPLILVLAAGLWAWSAVLAWRRPTLLGALRERIALLLVGEVVCLAIFAVCIFVRAQAPNATDTEKPMDLMLISSARTATDMPLRDLWFAGAPMSYYHLGPVMVDVVARVARVALGPEFILGVATAGALAGMAVFALAGDVLGLSPLRQRASPWIAGTVAVVSLLFLGTFEGFLDLLSAQGVGAPSLWGRLGIDGLPGPTFIEHGVPTQFWWWWRASRVLPGTINEFPAFSIVLGDLHAHVIALPLGVLAVATALPTFHGRTPLTWMAWTRHPGALLLAGAIFGGLAMTNTWDALIYGALWGAAALATAMSAGWSPLGALTILVRYFGPPAALAGVIAWPFFSSLQSTAFGVAVFTARGSDPVRFLVVWLPLLMPLAMAAVLLRAHASRNAITLGVAAGCAAVLAWAGMAIGGGEFSGLIARGPGWYTLAILVVAIGAGGAATADAVRTRDLGRAAWLGLAVAAGAVVLGTELVYLSDAFANRMNTVFKFWYAAWLLLAVAGAAGVGMAYDRMAIAHARWTAVLTVALGLLVYGGSLLWAPAATYARAQEGQGRGLDSLAYLDRTDPGGADAARWARAHLGAHDLLLEAVGQDYGEGNVISAASGVPTLLGWPGHELQWRGNIAPIGARRGAAATIYQDGATPDSRSLAQEQGVTYVYIGREERSQFGPDVATRFAAWPTAFDANGARIVQVPKS